MFISPLKHHEGYLYNEFSFSQLMTLPHKSDSKVTFEQIIHELCPIPCMGCALIDEI